MKNTKIFSLTLLTAITFLTFAQTAQAGSGSNQGPYGQYGGYGGVTPNQSIIIDKKVGMPNSTKGGVVNYVDNFSPNDPRYKPGQQVYFQIKVKNTSNVTLKNVVVKDIVPAYLEPIEGPGNFDSNTRTVTYTYAELKAGEEKTERLLMQIYPQDRLPTDKGLMCIVNKAEVQSGNISGQDSAQLCIEKEVIGIQKAPSAGPEMGIALMGLQALGLGAGLFIKRKLA
jgi:uncharacterized repeat protein (TIGR01451 family)